MVKWETLRLFKKIVVDGCENQLIVKNTFSSYTRISDEYSLYTMVMVCMVLYKYVNNQLAECIGI